MRPTLAEIIDGVSRTVGNRAAPMAMMNADNENYMEFAVGKVMLDYSIYKMDKEYGRLAKQNFAMEGLLSEAAAALKPLKAKEAGKLAKIAKKAHLDMNKFPALSLLHDKNVELRAGLEDFIKIHSAMEKGGSPELKKIRKKLWKLITGISNSEYKEAAEIFQWRT